MTSFTIALEDDTPTESQVQENTPPSEFKIVLGCISNLTALMTTSENLEAHAIEVYRTSKSSPAEGEEAFNRHWKWAVYQKSGSDYPFIT